MRKKQSYNPLQLTLFGDLEQEQPKNRLETEWEKTVKKDTLTTNKTQDHERNLSESNSEGRNDLHSSRERGHENNLRTSVDRSRTLQHNERTTAGTSEGNEGQERNNTLFDQISPRIQQESGLADTGGRRTSTRSQGDGVARVDRESWTKIKEYQSLLDFQLLEITYRGENKHKHLFETSPTANYIVEANLAVSKPGLRRLHPFLFEKQPQEDDVYKKVLDVYKDIINYHTGADDDWHQNLFKHASNVLAAVNRAVSKETEQVIPDTQYAVQNFHSTVSPLQGLSFSKVARYKSNINALDVLIKLQNEKRYPTEAEQTTLAQYVGWGGLKEIQLNPDKDDNWKIQSDISLRKYVKEVHEKLNTLDPDGKLALLDTAKRSILNAHYTSYEVINAIYHSIEKAGFKGGNILEPSAGIGNFLAAMPETMANNSEVTAIEMDQTSGRILQKLFPTAETYISPFEKNRLPENHYDLILSNIPFGTVKIFDPQIENNKNKDFSIASNNIHDYFFAKSILLAKPGAMIAFITSRYTLDGKKNRKIRELINDNCEFCGAVRLPDNAFKNNAGTEVVSDIIFLKKFRLGESREQSNQFMSVLDKPFTDHKGQSGIISYNEYFHNNPKHLLGTVEYGGLYREEEFNLKGSTDTNLYDEITGIANEIFKEPVLKNVPASVRNSRIEAEIEHYIAMKEYDTIGNLVVLQDGFIGRISQNFHINQELDAKVRALGIDPHTIRHNKNTLTWREEKSIRDEGIDIQEFYYRVVEDAKIRKVDLPKVKYIHTLREKTKELIFKETNGGYSDISLDNIRKELRETYNSFISRFNILSHKNNNKILDKEIDKHLLTSLERYNKEKKQYERSDILFKRTIHPVLQINKADNIQDAITLSLQKHGTIKMNYIAELMDKSHEEIIGSQKGDNTYIFKDENGNYLTREEYLSGNVVKKLKIAKEAAENDPFYTNNVEQLEKVQPEAIAAVDIYSPLHSRWIPQNYVNQFLQDLLKTDNYTLNFSPSLDSYQIRIFGNGANIDQFTTKRKSATWIVKHALNGIEPKVTYTKEDEQGKSRLMFDPEDTQLAKEIYRKIRSEWDDWKYKDVKRRQHLEKIYNSTFNTTVLRKYDGSKMKFPGLIGFTLRPHQRDAVFRNVQQLGGLNDHMVGAGKTLVQVATAMELRRLGLANKPMIIGLKSQIPQLYDQFKQAYPLSKVLFPSEKDFQKANRKKLLSNIATNDWDCIIISHSQFTKIQQPEDIQIKLLEELTATIKEELYDATEKITKKRLENKLYKYEQKLAKLNNSKKDTDVLDFSQLGIDFLMVDESQEFKNLEFSTTKKNIKGLGNPMGSQRAFNMLVAARYLQDYHNGDKGLLFSSGTPISNTMAELYLIFKYLRPNKMKEMGLTNFDRWAANFANDFSDLEYYMGRFKEVHRFREFVNLPELLTLYREIADVRNDTNLTLDKPDCEHHLVKIKPSETQLNLIEKLQKYINSKGNDYAAELGLEAGYDDRKKMNPSYAILAINFAKRLSLDPRLISPNLNAGTKLTAAADNISNIYKEHNDIKATQLVFCDIGTPKSKNKIDNIYDYLSGDISQADLNTIFGENYYEKKFKPRLEKIKPLIAKALKLNESETESLISEANKSEKFSVYSEIKRLLIERGVPSEEIAFIHDYNTRKQKEALYEQMNKGEMRVLLGSTKKLGTGVNVQERAIAGHHLDITWRPSDIDQRNGRIGRQGNEAVKMKNMDKVPMYYYATERTLDASMYNTTSQKARFIAQLKTTTNNDLRTIKDIEEDIDMGNMAAELSGDPIFKEKATLTKKVQELEQLEKSSKAKRYNIEYKLQHCKTLLKYYNERVAILEKNIPLLKDIPRDKENEIVFFAKLKNQAFSKPGEYGTAIVGETEHFKKYGTREQEFSLGELWGFKVRGRIVNTTGDIFGVQARREIISPLGDSIAPEKDIVKGTVAAAVQVRQAILEMPERLEKINRKIERETQNAKDYQKKIEEPFAYKEELQQKRGRLKEVNKIIKEKIKEEEQKKNQPSQEFSQTNETVQVKENQKETAKTQLVSPIEDARAVKF